LNPFKFKCAPKSQFSICWKVWSYISSFNNSNQTRSQCRKEIIFDNSILLYYPSVGIILIERDLLLKDSTTEGTFLHYSFPVVWLIWEWLVKTKNTQIFCYLSISFSNFIIASYQSFLLRPTYKLSAWIWHYILSIRVLILTHVIFY
jgi:hypothetical protein